MTAPLTLAELNERRRERAQLEADMGRLRKRLAVLTREILSGVAVPAPGAADGQLALLTEDRTDMETAAEEAVAHNRAEDVRRALLDRLDEGPADAESLLHSVNLRLLRDGRREAAVFEVSERLTVLVSSGVVVIRGGTYRRAPKAPPAPARPDLSADVRPPACGWEEAISLTTRLLVERGEEGTRAGEVEKATTRRSSAEAPRVVLDAYCAARVLALLDSAGVAACIDDRLSVYTPSIHLDGRNERARIASGHKLLADYLTGLVEDSEPQTSGELARALEVPEGLVVAALERVTAVWRDTDGRWKPKPKGSTRRVKAKAKGNSAVSAAEGSA